MRFNCLGDWERVTQGGIWNFRGNPVIITPYDGYSKPSTIELFTFEIWARIIDPPLAYHGKVKALASKLGEFVDVEPSSFDFEVNFYRVRVRLDVRKPLKKAISLIRGGQREIFAVRYDRLPDWCEVCGMMGHEFKEHGDRVHPHAALVFKNLRAPATTSWGTWQRNKTKKNNHAIKTDDGSDMGDDTASFMDADMEEEETNRKGSAGRKISLPTEC
ncbi:hypothetical protein D1007_42282 [Hordeum vulgare]|nr:hypothetical protein D1007_42279 [Hordeum vulgare]KAE8784203.1 hypothetical protein D1007_42282 [Hordeum vulgare]